MNFVFCPPHISVKSSHRRNLITLGIALMVFSVNAAFAPATSQAQGSAASSEKFIREQVAPGNVTVRQLRMVWQFLMEKKVYDPQDKQIDGQGKAAAPKPVSSQEETLVRHLSMQFTAFDLNKITQNDVKANPPAILPGDLLVQFFAWDKTGGVVVIRELVKRPDLCKVLIYVESDKSYTESVKWPISVYPDTEPRRPPRTGLLWLRPKATKITLSGTASSKSASATQSNEALQTAVKLLTLKDLSEDTGNWPAVARALVMGATNVDFKVGDYTLLDFAARFGDVTSTSILLKRGLSAKDNNSKSLYFASMWDSYKVVQLLLAAGAEVSAKDGLGRTPLHGAAQTGAKTVTRLLLAAGADVNAKDIAGWTPLKMAKQTGNIVIAAQLEAAGGKE